MNTESDFEKPTLAGEPPTAPTLPPQTASPAPTGFAGYEILGEIAKGGMGIVYKARRADLNRVVALKVMIAGEHATAEMLERFHREVKAAARLDHPNIVQILEVGAEGARHFFTMRYIEGEPLSRLIHRGEVSPRRAMEIAGKVAGALAYAHAQGVIHRDVKPSNILMDAAGEPLLADFGLAKDVSSQALTAPGATLGTPAYASPEQLEGDRERVGPRSDVYSLGATLYEMLVGRPPFQADSALETLAKVLYEEVVPPRKVNPRVQPDIETVCLKAMAKEPEGRYASAAEMAEDIRRYLDGEPIAARPQSWIGRRVRVARRYRGAVAASIAMVLVALGCGIWLVASSHRRQEDVLHGLEDASRWAKGARGAADRAARKTALTNAHNALLGVLKLDPENRTAAEVARHIEGELAALDQEERAAREAASRAATAAEDAVRKAGLVSKVLARWGRLLDTLRKLEANFYDAHSSKEDRRARADAIWPEVEAFIHDTPDDATSQAAMKALAGWAKVLSGRTADGAAMMREAADLDPDVPLGPLMQALVSFCDYMEKQGLPQIAFGRSGIQLGAPPEETKEMATVRGRMEDALGRARKARVWGKEGAEEIASAMEGLRAVGEGKYAEAEAALGRALGAPELRAFENGLLFARSKVRYLLKDFRGGREDLEKVVAARPNEAKSWDYLGRLLYGEAIETAWRGVDPREMLGQAIEAHTHAIGLDPSPAETWNNRSNARHELGDAQAERGVDARESYRQAMADNEEVMRRLPESAEAWTNHASERMALARAEALHGGDPRKEYAQAVDDFGEAIRRGPKYGPAFLGRGNAHKALGDAEAEHGKDPRGVYRRAIEDYDRALVVKPGFTEVYNNRGNVYIDLGKEEMSRGGDAREALQRGIADYDEAIARMPGSPEAHHNRGYASVLLAQAQQMKGEDARPTIQTAIEEYGKALAANPNDAVTYSNRGNAWLEMASAEGERGTDPRPTIEKAIEDYGKALAINPEYGDAYNNRGNALADVGEVELRLSIDARKTFERAIADYDETLRRNPEDAAAYVNRGNAWMKLGDARAAAKEEPKAAWEKALADFDAVLARNPRLWQGRANRGLLFTRLGEYAKAIVELEAAIAQVGDNAPTLKKWLAEAKEKLAAQPR